MNEPAQKGKIPDRINSSFINWGKSATIWRVIHSSLVVAATVSAILAATCLIKSLTPLFSLCAAISISLIGAFDLGDKANRLRNAWRILHAAIIKFEEVDDFTVDNLIEEYKEAEKTIGDVKATPRP